MFIESLESRRMFVHVNSLVLVNATTGQDVGPLADNGVINVALLGTRFLSVRAHGSKGTQSVKFRLDGRDFVDNNAAYALMGEGRDGGYRAWNAKNGSHRLAVTVYSEDDAAGFSGRISIRFKIANDPSAVSQPLSDSSGGDPRSLSFDDEFNGDSLNGWKTNIWWSPDGTDQNVGDERTSADNVSVSGGMLNLTATRSGNTFTSGIVTSEGLHEFQYGYVESRMKLPAGVGFWPGFWMLPANHNDGLGEIDIMEWVGDQPRELHTTYHQDDHDDAGKSDDVGVDLSAAFHTFGVDWQADSITWYLDGKEYFQTQNFTHSPMYVILNLAVGGDWAQTPPSDTQFPSSMQVDYVRVWDAP